MDVPLVRQAAFGNSRHYEDTGSLSPLSRMLATSATINKLQLEISAGKNEHTTHVIQVPRSGTTPLTYHLRFMGFYADSYYL